MMSVLKKKWNIVKHQNELNLENYVTDEVQTILFPFTIIQSILLVPKYRIKNNIITSNDVLLKIVILYGTAIYILVIAYQIIHNSDDTVQEVTVTKVQNFHVYINCIFIITGVIANCLNNIWIQSKFNVMFVLKLQKILRFFNNVVIYMKYVRRNRICIITIVCLYILFVIYNCLMYPNLPFHVILSSCIIIIFDIDMICAIIFIQLLNDMAVEWCRETVSYIENEKKLKPLFEIYIDLMKTYEMYKNNFHILVSF